MVLTWVAYKGNFRRVEVLSQRNVGRAVEWFPWSQWCLLEWIDQFPLLSLDRTKAYSTTVKSLSGVGVGASSDVEENGLTRSKWI